MKRIKAILVLLLAIVLVAGPVLPPAANAAPTAGSTSDSQGTGATAPGVSTLDTNAVQGDPGGSGDGLGADPENPAGGTAQSGGTDAVVEFLLQLLRLMQAAG